MFQTKTLTPVPLACIPQKILEHDVGIRAGSVSVFKSVFQKSVSVSVFQNIAISVLVFPHEPTIAYRMTQSLTPCALPFPPDGVWALKFALQITAIRERYCYNRQPIGTHHHSIERYYRRSAAPSPSPKIGNGVPKICIAICGQTVTASDMGARFHDCRQKRQCYFGPCYV